MAIKTQVVYTANLYIETCCECGVPFGITQDLYKSLQKSGDSFYCTNGHAQHYTRKRELEEQLESAQAKLAEEQEAREWYATMYRKNSRELKNTKNSLRATKAAHTRTKNRIANGVCPCCNRQFMNLHRHMETEHPDYISQQKDD